MEFRQIQYFVALYEEGSVTAAAHRLNVVQPAISMQLAKLEDEFGHRLFQRAPKGMIPTAAGHEAYRLLAPLLDRARLAKQALVGFGGRVAGHLSIGVIASVANNALSECIATYCNIYPEVSLRVTGGYTLDLIEMVESGKLDIAIVNNTTGTRKLSVYSLLREDLALIAAAGTHLALSDPAPLGRIADLKLVLPSPRHGLRTIMDAAAHEAGVTLLPRMEFDELRTIEEFVLASDHCTIMPPIAFRRALAEGRLKSLAINPSVSREIVCAHSPERGLSLAGERFIEQLQATLAAAIAHDEA
jgi:DNA-binding transcriptional LysR family regulator